jgi:hypothetical protein
LLSTNAQRPVTQEIAVGVYDALTLAVALDHLLSPPVGSVDVTTWPVLDTATQSVALSQPTTCGVTASFVAVHVPAPPPGFVDVSTVPLESATTHSVVVGHVGELSAWPSDAAGSPFVHEAVLSAGCLDARMWPESSVAMQSVVEGQATPVIVDSDSPLEFTVRPSTLPVIHSLAPPVTFAEAAMSPSK